jgi:DNA-binding MarR family transcriptional regulator
MLANPTPSIALLMHDIARGVRYRFEARTRPLGVTRQQWQTLFAVSRMDGPTQSELAERLEVERITACRMVDRLSEAGLIERRADPNDRRVWRLHVTEKAAPLIGQLNEIAIEVEKDYLSALTPHEAATLAEYLLRIRQNMRREDNCGTEPEAGTQK